MLTAYDWPGNVRELASVIERADGGTLFLDEVGELPLDAQVRLLRIVQDKVLERVGGGRPIHVDVRIIAATHRNLEEMVAEGKFREDLWYRLGVFPIPLPPLRERLADIPALATHFASRSGWRLGGASLTLSPSDIQLLTAYDWPGNVRELASVIERAAILGAGKRLDIAAAIGVRHNRASQSPPSFVPAQLVDTPFLKLDQAMAKHIEGALAKARGRIEGPGGAADLLGITPHTLRSRMRKLKVEWARFRGQNG